MHATDAGGTSVKKLPVVSGGGGLRFVRHTGIPAALLLPNLDTDVISPINPDSISGLSPGERAFETLRYLPDGSENPDFVLNQEPYRSASILLAGDNFGVGSAPESAVTRLMAFGIRSVIAPGFGPVFYTNCFAFGMLPVTLGEEVIEKIADRVVSNRGVEMTVDLERNVIECPGMEPISFSMDSRLRNKLLLSLNDLDEMLQHSERAKELRKEDRNSRPWIYVKATDARR